MSLRFARQFSSAFGYIKKDAHSVSVYAAQPVNQLELFTSLKEKDRDSVFHKVLSSIMFNQLNLVNRTLVFKPSVNKNVLARNYTPTAKIQLGELEQSVELDSRTYLGKPSRQDLRVIALSSKTPDQLNLAVNYLQQCLKLPKELGKNFDPVLTEMLLRRAAAAGNYQEIYAHLTRSKREFGKFMTQPFYSEALRIYALRMPYLSHRSKLMLKKLYCRSNIGLGRELSYAYGLSAYGQKFGMDKVQNQLRKTFEEVEKLMVPFNENPRRSLMKSATLTDLVIGYEAACMTDLPESQRLVKPLEVYLERTSHHREVTPSLVVNITEAQNAVEDPEIRDEPEEVE